MCGGAKGRRAVGDLLDVHTQWVAVHLHLSEQAQRVDGLGARAPPYTHHLRAATPHDPGGVGIDAVPARLMLCLGDFRDFKKF